MKSLKRILPAVSLFYFGMAVFFQIVAIFLFLEIRPPVPTSLFFLSEGFFGLLSVGFIALFIATIFFKNKEESMTCKSEPIPETGRNQKTLSVTGVMMLILFLNAGISFFAFAVVKSDGSPEIYGDRYVMAYKGKVIREIDRAEYYRESGRSTKSTAQVFAAFLLVFTGGILTAYLPEIKGFRVDFARFPFSRTRHLTRSRGQVRVSSRTHVLPTEMKAKIISALSAAMKDQDPKVRQQATLALGKIEDLEDINPLTDALRDEDAAVRNTAVQALQYFDDPLAVPHLLPLLADEHHHDAVLKVIENLCRAVQTLQFGYDPENQIRDKRRTVYDPDLSRLTIPLPELAEIVIYAQTCNIEQVRSLVRYAGQFYGENPLKNSICLTLYGNLHETDEKLFRELGSLCKNVIKK